MPENFNKSEMNSNQVAGPGGLVENAAFSTSFDGVGYETFETISGESIWSNGLFFPKSSSSSDLYLFEDDLSKKVGTIFDSDKLY